jgi:hypothetical protein
MQFTSYYSSPAEQALLALQVREAELRVAREELAFLQACGGVGAEDVKRLRAGLGLAAADSRDVVVVKEERVSDYEGSPPLPASSSSSSSCSLVSLETVLAPLIAADSSVAQLCRRVRPVLEREGVRVFKRQKAVHVRSGDVEKVLALGKGVWDEMD